MLTFLLAIQLGVAPPPHSVIRARIDSATREFQQMWRYGWQDAQNAQPSLHSGRSEYDDSHRAVALHCHFLATPLRIRKHAIFGSTRSQGTCPTWYPLDGARIVDERRDLDGALTQRVRPTLQALRMRLRQLLDTAAAQIPGDERIAGQRLRFALDAGDLAGAAIAASECNRDEVQCGLLRGFVLYRAGSTAAADSAFLAAAMVMRNDVRCAWNDVSMLLDKQVRDSYLASTCVARAEFEARLWWLADPLYLEPGNERRAEHFSRKTLVTLLSRLEFDGRQHWTPNKGGEAAGESLVRYGWPSHVYWAGREVDDSHDGWMLQIAHADTARPYVVPEYSRDRLHTLPLAHALESPFFKVGFDDWRLNAPRDDPDDDEWWPVEHYARDRSRIEGLPEGQRAMLRRSTTTRFVWAADLDARILTRAIGDSVQATIFESRAVAVTDSAGIVSGRMGSPLRVNLPLEPGVAFVAIEIPGDSARPAARTRFGVEIPETLAALSGGAALSQPLLFEPPAIAATVIDADSALARMYGTTSFMRERRLGVYWESYGVGVRDTVQIELRLSREDRPGIMERVGDVLRIGREDANSVDILWREVPGSSRAVQRMEGTVPVGMHSLVLDLSRLSRGTYSLRVTVNGTRAMGAGGRRSDSATSEPRTLVLR